MANIEKDIPYVDSNGSNGFYQNEGYSISVPTILCRKKNEGFIIKQIKLEKESIIHNHENHEEVGSQKEENAALREEIDNLEKANTSYEKTTTSSLDL